jgi:hypothetical protein
MKIACYKDRDGRRLALNFNDEEFTKFSSHLAEAYRANLLPGRVLQLVPDNVKGWFYRNRKDPKTYRGVSNLTIPVFGTTPLAVENGFWVDEKGININIPDTPVRDVGANKRKATNKLQKIRNEHNYTMKDLRDCCELLQEIAGGLKVKIVLDSNGEIAFKF